MRSARLVSFETVRGHAEFVGPLRITALGIDQVEEDQSAYAVISFETTALTLDQAVFAASNSAPISTSSELSQIHSRITTIDASAP